mmetsp:Transcript_65863/g.175112  ORF Transcript_65863/g.175112 Transcript_65863/m.175112 type:complete len:319 (-) Transcript_65863:717-1673(-)
MVWKCKAKSRPISFRGWKHHDHLTSGSPIFCQGTCSSSSILNSLVSTSFSRLAKSTDFFSFSSFLLFLVLFSLLFSFRMRSSSSSIFSFSFASLSISISMIFSTCRLSLFGKNDSIMPRRWLSSVTVVCIARICSVVSPCKSVTFLPSLTKRAVTPSSTPEWTADSLRAGVAGGMLPISDTPPGDASPEAVASTAGCCASAPTMSEERRRPCRAAPAAGFLWLGPGLGVWLAEGREGADWIECSPDTSDRDLARTWASAMPTPSRARNSRRASCLCAISATASMSSATRLALSIAELAECSIARVADFSPAIFSVFCW